MPSITSWTRLEPRARNETMTTSLQARIHDPLWLLARQWQLGEFQGEDNGSPIRAELQIEQSQLEKYLPGRPNASSSTSSKSFENNLPLEAWVEREPVRQAMNYRLAAEAGLQFMRFAGPTLTEGERTDILSKYAIKPPSEDDRRNFDSATLRFLSVMAGRVIDGLLLRSESARPGKKDILPDNAPFNAIQGEPRNRVIDATTAWLDWYDTLFSQPQHDAAWVSGRMEYEFAVSAPAPSSSRVKGELVLVAPEHSEGHLDWYSFEVDTKHNLGASGKPQTPAPIVVIPAPIHFRGMPATRFWEFEDAGVNFGGLDTAPEDLGRLLLAEFALIYGNDFFVIPIEFAVGSICSIASLRVINTFGEVDIIQSTSKTDGAKSPWRMFCVSPLDERVGTQSAPLDFLFLPPALGASFESASVEEVLLLRDEMANMAWAVERIVESPSGRPLNRFESYQEERRRQEAADPNLTTPRSGQLEYRLATSVPPYWIPLIPVQTGWPGRNVELRLDGLNKPLGQLLKSTTAGQALALNEEEVPRAGARVTRAYQYARWIDGSTHLWIGRRKQAGRGEGSSGLRFDVVEPGSAEK